MPDRKWAPPEAERELAREGEVRAAQMRLIVAGAGAITVLITLSFPTPIYISGYTLLLLAGLVEMLFLQRNRTKPPGWLSTVSCLFDITVLNAMNAAFVLAGNPLAATNSRAFFTVTVLFLSLSCLRQNPRLALGAGAVAIAQYAALVLWVAARFDLHGALYQQEFFGRFTWASQYTRFAMLAAATAINVSIINTSRRYWSDSVHDSLTGLVNRRYAEKRLEEALATARRTRHPLVLALADVDHFKFINDGHGHAAGDAVLCAIADALRHTFRSSDVLARFGGDEFFMLFPEADPAATIERLTHFHATLTVDAPIRTTLSMGVATWPADGDSEDSLLARADERLYDAKQAGRGRITLPPTQASREREAVGGASET
jgi:diguanylate cyclase (GGDEF)-like protein